MPNPLDASGAGRLNHAVPLAVAPKLARGYYGVMASEQQNTTPPPTNTPERTAVVHAIVNRIVRDNAETLRKLAKT